MGWTLAHSKQWKRLPARAQLPKEKVLGDYSNDGWNYLLPDQVLFDVIALDAGSQAC